MSDNRTIRMLDAFRQTIAPTRFLSSFFKSPPKNFYNSEKFEIDIKRGSEKVAIAIQDLSVGPRMNSSSNFTNKEFTAPIFEEAAALNSFDLMKRVEGQNPFEDPNFQRNATSKSFELIRELVDKIRRTTELQASQVLQTGIVTLIDDNGDEVYNIDFKPKATHFPTSGTTWDQVGDDKLGDLQSLANVNRDDGLVDDDILVFGETALNSFLGDTEVKSRLDNRRFEVGQIAPVKRGEGATFYGFVWIGNYRFEIWSYNGRYEHPQTSVSTRFVDPGKVIMLSSTSRYDATFGAIPTIVPPDSRVLPFLPPRLSDGISGMDVTTSGYVSLDGKQLFVSAGSRPLMVPTAIDSYGCLDTGL